MDIKYTFLFCCSVILCPAIGFGDRIKGLKLQRLTTTLEAPQ